MKVMKMLIICLLLIGSMVACGGGDKEKEAAADKDQPKKQAKAQDQKASGRLQTAHYLEEEVETLPEISHSSVVIQEQDAYIAVKLHQERGPELQEELKNKIVGLVRITDPEIKNIYISENMDFNTRMQSFTKDIERGLPAKAIGDSFEQTIRRVFPELKN